MVASPPSSRPSRAQDASYPTAHVRPPVGWLNDPNGPVRWRGRWHLFFQHNPAGPVHGEICWGHASSADLATWDIEPVALAPTRGGPDAAGCWSGCVVVDDGVATAVYTGLADEDPLSAGICLAYAQDDDLRSWQPDPMPVAVPPQAGRWTGYRDPFVFTFRGRRYAVVGAGTADGGAVVLLYACDDLRRWSYLGPFLEMTDPVAAALAPAEIWECPQLARIGNRWVLILSTVLDDTLGRVAYLVGDLVTEGDGLRFAPRNGGLVDHGRDFYAPAILVEDDRVLLWGWSWEDRAAAAVVASGWAGALTWPRSLALVGDRLVTAPAAEVARLRLDSSSAVIEEGAPMVLPEGPVDIELSVEAGAPVTVRLGGAGHDFEFVIDLGAGSVRAERPIYEEHRRGWPAEGAVGFSGLGQMDLRLVVDGAFIELYVDDGPAFTERSYPSPGGLRHLQVSGAGTARATVHRLAAAVRPAP